MNRYHTQGHFFRLIDSFYRNVYFGFRMQKYGKIQPNNPTHLLIYQEYQSYLRDIYNNENTIHFYEYSMYSLLLFLEDFDLTDMSDLTSDMIFNYFKTVKVTPQREVLSELRGIFRYLDREDFTYSIAGVHTPRIKRIISTLTEKEIEKSKWQSIINL